ncbi:MAG: hypothetical protein HN417_09945, partial [Desulfobacula sp.]|nr:hypothetical protein [Desulfobacula sp.]
MKLSVRKIADIINAKVIGDPNVIIKGVSSFDDAGPEEISFADDVKYLTNTYESLAGAIIVPENFFPEDCTPDQSNQIQYNSNRPLLLSANP